MLTRNPRTLQRQHRRCWLDSRDEALAIDPCIVTEENLAFHATATKRDIGIPKLEALRRSLLRIVPGIVILIRECELAPD